MGETILRDKKKRREKTVYFEGNNLARSGTEKRKISDRSFGAEMISSEIKKKKLRKTISRKVIVRETRERKRGVDRHWRVADSGILNVAVEKKKRCKVRVVSFIQKTIKEARATDIISNSE